MGRATKFLAACIAVVALGGVVAVGAQTEPPPVRVCIKAGTNVQAPRDGSCAKGFTLETLARQSDVVALSTALAGKAAQTDVNALAQELADLEERVADLEPGTLVLTPGGVVSGPGGRLERPVGVTGVDLLPGSTVEICRTPSGVCFTGNNPVAADGTYQAGFLLICSDDQSAQAVGTKVGGAEVVSNTVSDDC